MIAPALAPATSFQLWMGFVGCSANPHSAPASPSPFTPPPLNTASASSIHCIVPPPQLSWRRSGHSDRTPAGTTRQPRLNRIAAPVSLLDSALVRLLPAVPKLVVQRFSSRYIAGATLAEAVECVRGLNSGGKMATVDVLGEEISHEDETRAIAQAYDDVFAAIDEAELDANVSVKLTALGLELSYDLCRENLLDVVRTAAGYGNFVRIDMENSSTTDETLQLYRELREDGHENLGVVLQARLRRTPDDVEALADLRPSVRLCKGIYLEPGTIAFADFEAVRANFVRCLDALLEAECYVGVATHDEWLIGESLAQISQRGLGPLEYELQMLLGVREERREELVEEGHRLRVYVAFGEHWYGYSLRRLQENPAMAGTIAKATAGRVLRLGAR